VHHPLPLHRLKANRIEPARQLLAAAKRLKTAIGWAILCDLAC